MFTSSLPRPYPRRPGKLLRSKKILVDGKPAKSSTRVESEEQIRLLVDLSLYATPSTERIKKEVHVSDEDVKWIETIIIWEDESLIALNKPQGLAVQGGTGTKRHLDAIMKVYNPEARLVHRIDKDTSGVLVMAKTIPMANTLPICLNTRGYKKPTEPLLRECSPCPRNDYFSHR